MSKLTHTHMAAVLAVGFLATPAAAQYGLYDQDLYEETGEDDTWRWGLEDSDQEGYDADYQVDHYAGDFDSSYSPYGYDGGYEQETPRDLNAYEQYNEYDLGDDRDVYGFEDYGYGTFVGGSQQARQGLARRQQQARRDLARWQRDQRQQLARQQEAGHHAAPPPQAGLSQNVVGQVMDVRRFRRGSQQAAVLTVRTPQGRWVEVLVGPNVQAVHRRLRPGVRVRAQGQFEGHDVLRAQRVRVQRPRMGP